MKKRTLWIILAVFFGITTVYSLFTLSESGIEGLIGCALVTAVFGVLAARTSPDARFKPKPKRARAKKIRVDSAGDYTAIDLETTGLTPEVDRIIELGAVRVRNGKPVATYSQLVDPGIPIPPQVRRITGITDSDVQGKPTIDKALPEFIDFIGSDPLVGHNIIRFDSEFLRHEAARTGNTIRPTTLVDTLPMAQFLFPTQPRHRLVDLIQLLGVSDIENHRASDDALQTAQCYEAMKAYAKRRHIDLRNK